MILHVDGDAFFAACEQAMHPEWRGKPVVTGKERGIVSAASYEAKKFGVSRSVPLWQVKTLCPEAIIVASDYDAYTAYARRMYAIARRYAPVVEEYSIDEAFADVTGMDGALKTSFMDIGKRIQDDIKRELDVSVSVGIAATKTLAKVGSKWGKPHGLDVITPMNVERYLRELPVEKVWGIGSQFAAKCRALGVHTAQELTMKPAGWIAAHFPKPFQDTVAELRGERRFPVDPPRPERASIQKTRTFTPSDTQEVVFAHLLKNLENACIKARRHGLTARAASIFLKTQEFRYANTEVTFARATAYPHEMAKTIAQAFRIIHRPGTRYRASGVTLFGLVAAEKTQLTLFESAERSDAMRRVYAAVDALAERYGKHTVRLADSMASAVGGGRRRETSGTMTRLAPPRSAIRIPVLSADAV